MKLTSDMIKKEILANTDGGVSKIKRLSKRKNDDKQVVRNFEVVYTEKEVTIMGSCTVTGNKIRYYKVTSDSSDTEIINIEETSYDLLLSEEKEMQAKKNEALLKKLNGYIFCVTKDPMDIFSMGIMQHTVIIEKKTFWSKNKHLDDSPCAIFGALPKHIEDMNETGVMASNEEDYLKIIKDLESLGLTYSNDLAEFAVDRCDIEAYIKP